MTLYTKLMELREKAQPDPARTYGQWHRQFDALTDEQVAAVDEQSEPPKQEQQQ